MAWHDRAWDGRVCFDPATNTYCTGTHSLLSARLAREKLPDKEKSRDPLDAGLPDYLPPCFWTSSAFAKDATNIRHQHPFRWWRDEKVIEGQLAPYSVLTWPFRLSITHTKKPQRGQYFPDLEERMQRFRERLQPKRSLVFFYLNYDNPVSADEYKYALVGCARIAGHELTGEFPFTEDELKKFRAGDGMRHFGALNWALQVTHEGEGRYVRLPYHEYLERIAAHPEDEPKLEAMRVLVEEPALVPRFKYVSEQLNDDHALALLYKMRRALQTASDHGIADVTASLALVEEFIGGLWEERGPYPGLGAVLSALADLAEGEVQKESARGDGLVAALRAQSSDEDLLDRAFALISSSGAVPTALAKHRGTISDVRAALKGRKAWLPALKQLSLFALTPRQVGRILYPDQDATHAFGGLPLKLEDIARNPYLLAESYVPAIAVDRERTADLDREQPTDGVIDYLTIDLGMFPDRDHVDRRDDLHHLTVTSPERLRSFALEALNQHEERGHSFAPTSVLADEMRRHPLFSRDRLSLQEDELLTEERLAHFRERLHVRDVNGQWFFYLKETKVAEEMVAKFISQRLAKPDIGVRLDWLEQFLGEQSAEIAAKIPTFDAQAFHGERSRLMSGALQRPLFCITGRPGAGKSQALLALLDRLSQMNESAIVLAPTGKAALRLSSNAPAGAKWTAETIDRWINRSGLRPFQEGEQSLAALVPSEDFHPVENLVIDEMSMVGLHQLALVFRAFEVNHGGGLKRLILVGDENQLPPIGCGRPFYDLVLHLTDDPGRRERHFVRLTTNCRQQSDLTVLDAAYLFSGKNRYHTELYSQLLKGGEISSALTVRYWSDPRELQGQVADFFTALLRPVQEKEKKEKDKALTPEAALNVLFGLYDSGYVPGAKSAGLTLDRAQILTPYRAGSSGALGLSDFVRAQYRPAALEWKKDSAFVHSDKLICVANRYVRNFKTERRELQISNGSIGVVTMSRGERKAFFAEREWPIDWDSLKEDELELAYAITVSKSQGSEFQEVLLVVPERRALLCRELIYTAMTRSKTQLTMLVQKAARGNPLEIARSRSAILMRNSSVFSEPFDARRVFEPETGLKVQSKIEYMIYTALRLAREAGRLTFKYEQPRLLPLNGHSVTVKPDFTIECGGVTYYWEHLGMLDRVDYARGWRDRVAGYAAANLMDRLVTTDDLGGVRQERIDQVVNDLVAQRPGGTREGGLSHHHYTF